MNSISLTTLSTVLETVIWLAVLLALRSLAERELSRQQKAPASMRPDLTLDYTPFKMFASLRVLGNLIYLGMAPITHELRLSAPTVSFCYSSSYWAVYLFQALAVFLMISSLIRSSLRPLPGLAFAAIVVFRWAAALIFIMAITAHAPLFRANNWQDWLTELCVSFQFCVCSFELTLLVLLLVHMRRLGMFIRSRIIGFALGLAVFGLSDYVTGFITMVAPRSIDLSNIVLECIAAFTAAVWTYYIVMPEPKRQPHSLSPASSLMKWNEVAIKLGMGGRQSEQVPFISGVESKVDAVLDRFKARVG